MSPHWPNNKLSTVNEDKPVMEDDAGHTDNLLTCVAIDPFAVYFDDESCVHCQKYYAVPTSGT